MSKDSQSWESEEYYKDRIYKVQHTRDPKEGITIEVTYTDLTYLYGWPNDDKKQVFKYPLITGDIIKFPDKFINTRILETELQDLRRLYDNYP